MQASAAVAAQQASDPQALPLFSACIPFSQFCQIMSCSMRRVSLHAAAAGLLVALAVPGLTTMSAADDVEVFIQPNIAVIGGCK